MEGKTWQIFISYRRNGTDAHARVFYEKLREKGYTVFLDFESLYSGGFEDAILTAVDSCTDFILLLPEKGLDRCREEDDLLRKEIRQALTGGKNILPVFVNGFVMPDREALPEDIADLAGKNGIDCPMEYFSAVFDKVCRNLNSVPEDRELYAALQELRKRTLALDHGYFRKWACIRLNAFLTENDDFFDGINLTDPHAEDTFGITGIGFTRRDIKAITAVSDYWQDPFIQEYLNRQAELIKRGVTITRVFILEEGQYEKAREQMRLQASMGIRVFYINKGNPYLNPEWLEEDYLIQDDSLLVEITCRTHKFEGEARETERITTSLADVSIKLERFQRILERSARFTEEDL